MTLSAERPRLIVPGLLPADPAVERYRVHPGAVTAVELDPGDVLTVTDAEGRQRGELTVLAGGREDYGALGTAADTAATVLRALARPGAPRPPGRPSRPGPMATGGRRRKPPRSSASWRRGGSTRSRRARWRCSGSGRPRARGRSSPRSSG